MTIFKTLQTPNVFGEIKCIHDHYLLDMFGSFQQKSAFIVMSSFAIVANHSFVSARTIVQNMTKSRTFKANESLRALVWLMLWRKTKETRKLVQTSEIVMTHSFASETLHIIWKISLFDKQVPKHSLLIIIRWFWGIFQFSFIILWRYKWWIMDFDGWGFFELRFMH